MIKNLTPMHLRCPVGECPSVHQTEDGRLVITGPLAEDNDQEATIVVSGELLSGLKDLVQPTSSPVVPQCDQRHAQFEAKAREIIRKTEGFGPGLIMDIASALSEADAKAREECAKIVSRHVQHKAEAGEAVREALSLCQHSPEEWMAMPAELREFKLRVFGTLEMRCLNLGPPQRLGEEAQRADTEPPLDQQQHDTKRLPGHPTALEGGEVIISRPKSASPASGS